jgi:hypothetical protein
MRSHSALAIVTLSAALSAALLAACSDVTAPDTTARVVSAARTTECCPGLRLCLCQGKTARAPEPGLGAASGVARTASPPSMTHLDRYSAVSISRRESGATR